jgi:hypothetical protein
MFPRILSASLVLLSFWMGSHGAGAEQDLERDFRTPPPECRPEVFWDWMGGMVSREGITRDLEG